LRGALLLVPLMIVTIMIPYSADAQSPAQEMAAIASHLPDVDFFAAVRTDPEFIDSLDSIMLRLTADLPEDVAPRRTVRELLNEVVSPIPGIDIVAILNTWLGKYAAAGVSGIDNLLDDSVDNDSDVVIYIALELKNRLLAEATLAFSGIIPEATREEFDGYTVYTSSVEKRVMVISDDIALLAIGTTDVVLNPAPSLAENPDFIPTIDELPGDGYSSLVYGKTFTILQQMASDSAMDEILSSIGLQANALGAAAMGFSILDETSLIVDLAQARGSPFESELHAFDADFAEFFPADSLFMIHTTDLKSLTDAFAGLIASISASDTPESIYERFETLSELLLGLDLRDDILDFAQGDYGGFVQINADDLALQFAIVFESDDSAQAQVIVRAMRDALDLLLADRKNVTITPVALPIVSEGVSTTIDAISVTFASQVAGPIQLVIGAHQRLLFVATRAAMDDLFAPDNRLTDTSAYIHAYDRWLSDAAVLVYLDGAELSATLERSALMIQPLLEPIQSPLLNAILTTESGRNLIESATISLASNANNSLLLRIVLTLTPA
jgi:hypothetical protein